MARRLPTKTKHSPYGPNKLSLGGHTGAPAPHRGELNAVALAEDLTQL